MQQTKHTYANPNWVQKNKTEKTRSQVEKIINTNRQEKNYMKINKTLKKTKTKNDHKALTARSKLIGNGDVTPMIEGI